MSDLRSPTFAALGLSDDALLVLARAGFDAPTPIQTQAIPPVLAGHDLIGCAATGTGKTAAFVLPIVERILAGQATSALILTPTRELAHQIAEQLARFGRTRGIRSVTVIGGVGMGPQISALRTNPTVIVATPGRLVDLLSQGAAKLDHIDVLVLDEADRMLDMGFRPQLDRILARLPRKRQTLLFSATIGKEVADFAKSHLAHPIRVEATPSGTTAARAVQRVFAVPQNEKTALLLTLLQEDEDSTLVFARTKRRTDTITRHLERAGHKVTRIHANRSQNQREIALRGFREGEFRVLVATDIAARGLDVAGIGHVVLFDLPHVPEDYVHRIGRTARASATGKASSFVAPEEANLLRDIERFTKSQVPRLPVPRESEVFQSALQRCGALPEAQQGRGRTPPSRPSARSPGSRPQGTAPRPSPRGDVGQAPSQRRRRTRSVRPAMT